MFEKLENIMKRPKPYEFYTAEVLWNDDHISGKMLDFHLNENADLASRNKEFINRSLEFLVSRFNIGRGTAICDFGCGPGLYTIGFAAKGADTTGIDFSKRSILYARRVAEENNLEIEYVQQNYLDFETDKRYDLITMIFCDFCALNPDQRKSLLTIFHGIMTPGGSIFMDVCGMHAFERRKEAGIFEHQLLDGFWSADDYYGFMNTFKYDDEKVVLDKYTIIEKSRTWDVYNWLQYYSLESLAKEFEENGFRVIEQYSDAAGGPYRPDAPEIAITAIKK